MRILARKKGKSGKEKFDPHSGMELELTKNAYETLRDTFLNTTDIKIRSMVKPALNFFREISPVDALTSILEKKTIGDYYPQKLGVKHKIALGIAKGYVKANPQALEELKAKLNKRFVKLLLRYENPQVYKALMDNISQEKIDDWIQKNIDDLINILKPKKNTQ